MGIEEKLQEVLEKIAELEEEYGVSILARSGSYGSARLVVNDNKTGEELARN